MKIDVPYFFLLCVLQLAIFSARSDFMLAHNLIVWAFVCGVAFTVYPWLWLRLLGSAGLRFASVAARAILLFVLSVAVGFVALGFTASEHFAEWPLGLFFVAVPAATVSLISLFISYGVLRLTRIA